MQYRALGNTGLQASVVGFGVWTVATKMWGITDEAFGASLLQLAFERGINFYDTADVYGDGRGETLLADALGDKRDEIVIGTKFGYDFYTTPGVQPGQRERPHDWSPAFVRMACEKSLQRLRTDRIDLYQMHNPRLDALQSDDLFATLEALKAEGKIRSYGAALGPALKADRQIEEGLYCVRERRAPVQIIYNLIEQVLGEAICPVAQEFGVQVLVRVPHASDMLLGHIKADTKFAADDHRSFRQTDPAMQNEWQANGLRKVEQLGFLTEPRGRTLGQMAIQFLLAEPSIGGIFPNIYDAALVEELAAAPDTPAFTTEERQQVLDLYANNFYLSDMEVAEPVQV